MKRLFVILASLAVLVGGSHAQLVIKNTDGTELMTVNNSGNVMMETLKGSGTRMVVADAGGNLSTQTIPSGGGADGVVTGGSVSGTSTKTVTLTRSNSLPNVTFSFSDAVDDADHSASNEIQTLSKSGSTVSLSRGGGSFTDAVNDADHSASNEIQTLSKSGSTVSLSRGGGSFTDAVNDADHSASNEIQNLNQVLSTGNNANQQNAVNFGKIGINTTSPATQLHVVGNIMVGAHTTARPDGRSIVFGNGDQAWIGSTDGFKLNGDPLTFPRPQLHISGHGNLNSQDRFVALMDNVNIGYSLYLGTGDNIVNAYNTHGKNHAIHHWSGAHLTNSGQWVNSSSRKNKENIRDLDINEAYSALDELKPVTFAYKVDPDETQVGFIAEDVPELVAIGDRSGLASMDIVGVLTKIIQDQNKRIERLENMLK